MTGDCRSLATLGMTADCRSLAALGMTSTARSGADAPPDVANDERRDRQFTGRRVRRIKKETRLEGLRGKIADQGARHAQLRRVGAVADNRQAWPVDLGTGKTQRQLPK